MAEALAMKEGLSLAVHKGCNNVIMESDSLETVEACTGDEVWWNESSVIFTDCVDLDSSVQTIQFKYCPREANQVAHEIAKSSFSTRSSCNWDDEPPSFLLSVIISDVTI